MGIKGKVKGWEKWEWLRVEEKMVGKRARVKGGEREGRRKNGKDGEKRARNKVGKG